MPESVHLVVHREEPYSCFVTSPQLPGFIYGAVTFEAALEGLPEALKQEGVTAPTELHIEEWHTSPDGTISRIRVARDAHQDVRRKTADRLHDQLDDNFHFDWFVRDHTDSYAFICVVESDRVRWVADQLNFEGSALAIALIEGDGITYRPMQSPDIPTDLPTLGIAPYLDMTVRELIDAAATYDVKSGGLRSGPGNASMFAAEDPGGPPKAVGNRPLVLTL